MICQLQARELGVKEVMEKYRKKSKPQKIPQEQQSDPIPVKLELKLQRSKVCQWFIRKGVSGIEKKSTGMTVRKPGNIQMRH